jgi:preprotein translocase subunit SecD
MSEHTAKHESTKRDKHEPAKTSAFMRLMRNPRVIALIIAIIIATILIAPNPTATGVVITGVERDSAAQQSGISPGFVVTELLIESQEPILIDDALGFEVALSQIPAGSSFTLFGPGGVGTIEIEENGSTSESGLSFVSAPRSNVKLGLDLSGGTRILISIDEEVDEEVYGSLVDAIRERLNVFGLSDVVVRPSSDLSGNQYVLVELAGISEQQVRDVVATQGVFEAKIVNDTVFEGGRDITSVCRSAECSGIDPFQGCRVMGQEWVCSFFFQITLRPEAAQRSADLTRDIPIVGGSSGYLAENLSLILDGELVDSLRISASLRGQATTTISISGAGYGPSQSEAREDALENMRRLQTILQTGSLPVQISIVRVDTVSPSLGDSFLRNALLVGLLVLLSIIATLVAVYRTPKLSIPISVVALSELVLILGVAAAINWSLDLASIAGIIVAIGTGVDDQIIISNEVLRGRKSRSTSWKQMITAAFFIIFGAYATTVAAMLPLLFAGAGLLRGFALTTIIGVTIGVLITRPAFAAILEVLIGGDQK